MALRLPDSEWMIMELLWNQAPQTSTELYDMLKSDKGWTKSTIKTLLARLLDKDAITFEKKGRSRYYSPKLIRDTCMNAAKENLIQRFYSGASQNMLLNFIKEESLTENDIQALENLLEEKKKQLRKRP